MACALHMSAWTEALERQSMDNFVKSRLSASRHMTSPFLSGFPKNDKSAPWEPDSEITFPESVPVMACESTDSDDKGSVAMHEAHGWMAECFGQGLRPLLGLILVVLRGFASNLSNGVLTESIGCSKSSDLKETVVGQLWGTPERTLGGWHCLKEHQKQKEKYGVYRKVALMPCRNLWKMKNGRQ